LIRNRIPHQEGHFVGTTRFPVARLVAALVLVVSSFAAAAPVDFTIDPAQSRVRLGGTFNGVELGPQMPGSDVTGYTGTVTAEIDRAAGTLSFNTDTPQALDQPVDQQPLNEFRQGANYGLTPVGTLPIFLAARGMDLNLGGTNAPFNAGAPTFEQVGFYVNGGTLYYSTPDLPGGVADLHGYGGLERVIGPLTLTQAGGIETLTIPIGTNFSPYTGEGGDAIALTLDGQIVATRVVPEPGAAVLIVAGGLVLGRRRRRA
jgi:hypothetical protein